MAKYGSGIGIGDTLLDKTRRVLHNILPIIIICAHSCNNYDSIASRGLAKPGTPNPACQYKLVCVVSQTCSLQPIKSSSS
jgi:hypothetical protein